MQKHLFLCAALLISSMCLAGADESTQCNATASDLGNHPAYADATNTCSSCPSNTSSNERPASESNKDVAYRLADCYCCDQLRIERCQNGRSENLSAYELIKGISSEEAQLLKAISAFDGVKDALWNIQNRDSRVALLPVLKHFESVLNRKLFYNSCVSGLCAAGSAAVLGGIAYRLRNQNMMQTYGTTQLGYGLVGALGCGSCVFGACTNAIDVRHRLKRCAYAILENILYNRALIVGGDEREVACVLERITKKLS